MLHFRCYYIALAFIVFCFTAYARQEADMLLVPPVNSLWANKRPLPIDCHNKQITFLSFYIDQYEVTNSQYEEFILDGGYQNSASWSEAGWQFITENKIDRPLGLERTLYNAPNQPVVGVSWYEAPSLRQMGG